MNRSEKKPIANSKERPLIQPPQERSEIVFQKSKPILDISAPIQVDVDHSINDNPLPYQNEVKIKPNSKGISIAYLTIRGAARVLGVSEAALRKAFQGANLEVSKMLEMLSKAGFQGANLEVFSVEGIPDIAFANNQAIIKAPIVLPRRSVLL